MKRAYSNTEEYYDLTNNKTLRYTSIEGFAFNTDAPKDMDMKTDISNNNLIRDKDKMTKDPAMDYSSTVSNPNGYGYIPSLNETRNQDAKDIINQESSIFAVGAIAGVSLVVFSILITSTQTNPQ
jgi:hypothetical protein